MIEVTRKSTAKRMLRGINKGTAARKMASGMDRYAKQLKKRVK